MADEILTRRQDAIVRPFQRHNALGKAQRRHDRFVRWNQICLRKGLARTPRNLLTLQPHGFPFESGHYPDVQIDISIRILMLNAYQGTRFMHQDADFFAQFSSQSLNRLFTRL